MLAPPTELIGRRGFSGGESRLKSAAVHSIRLKLQLRNVNIYIMKTRACCCTDDGLDHPNISVHLWVKFDPDFNAGPLVCNISSVAEFSSFYSLRGCFVWLLGSSSGVGGIIYRRVVRCSKVGNCERENEAEHFLLGCAG